MSVAGFVVAGGRSARMGRDKALLPWGDATLLDHAIARLSAVCGDVRILCGPEERYADHGVPVVVDVVRDAGSLGGLLTGLELLTEEPALFLAVDLPHVTIDLLRFLAGLATACDAVVPLSPNGPEPLCAVYGPACLAPVRRSIERGAFRMTSFWSDVRVREVSQDELPAFGDPVQLFRNVNTPDDYSEGIRER